MIEDIRNKKNAALQATLDLISENGFHGTPMSKIAEKANIGVGTIYRYFDNKDDLINALYIDIKNRSSKVIFKNYSKDLPVSDNFIRIVQNIVIYYISNPTELSFIEQFENSPLITEETHKNVELLAEPLLELFQYANEQNIIKKIPFETLISLFNGAIISLTKLYLSKKVKPDENSLANEINAIWDMIKR